MFQYKIMKITFSHFPGCQMFIGYFCLIITPVSQRCVKHIVEHHVTHNLVRHIILFQGFEVTSMVCGIYSDIFRLFQLAYCNTQIFRFRIREHFHRPVCQFLFPGIKHLRSQKSLPYRNDRAIPSLLLK